MKAVNLIPQDTPRSGRRARRANAGGGGALGVYVLLAVLAAAVAIVGSNAYAQRRLADRQAALVSAESSARAAEAKAAALVAPDGGGASATARVQTIEGLLAGRFDWSHSLRDVARAVPSDVSLVSLVGTVAPGTQIAGGGGGSLRAALPVPAIDLIGCAPSHPRVATLLTRLRALDGVQRVSLASSEKSDTASLNDTDCRSNDKMPQFQMTVFYDAPEGLVPAVDAAAAAAGETPAPTATGGTQ
jgi:Tfp pilus assembly protein PilN